MFERFLAYGCPVIETKLCEHLVQRVCVFTLFFSASDVRNQAAKLERVAGPDVMAAGLCYSAFVVVNFTLVIHSRKRPGEKENFVSISKENVYFFIAIKYEFTLLWI